MTTCGVILSNSFNSSAESSRPVIDEAAAPASRPSIVWSILVGLLFAGVRLCIGVSFLSCFGLAQYSEEEPNWLVHASVFAAGCAGIAGAILWRRIRRPTPTERDGIQVGLCAGLASYVGVGGYGAVYCLLEGGPSEETGIVFALRYGMGCGSMSAIVTGAVVFPAFMVIGLLTSKLQRRFAPSQDV